MQILNSPSINRSQYNLFFVKKLTDLPDLYYDAVSLLIFLFYKLNFFGKIIEA